jgi:CheY-like chemotaxis protein
VVVCRRRRLALCDHLAQTTLSALPSESLSRRRRHCAKEVSGDSPEAAFEPADRVSCRTVLSRMPLPGRRRGIHHALRRSFFSCYSQERLWGKEVMPGQLPLVSVVDDDESVRESLPDLLREFGYSVRAFSSALEFLTSDALDQTRCLILDIAMPRMTGIELQAELKRLQKQIPIIFITATRDETIRARVIELGAAACLTKPFTDTVLLEKLCSAIIPD